MKKLFLFLIFVAFAFSAAITPKKPQMDDDGYYLVSSAEELWGLAQMVDNRLEKDSLKEFNVRLTKDIVVNKNVLNEHDTLSKDTSAYECWPSMGTPYHLHYRGVFDGQGHSISGLVRYRKGGLFTNFSSGTIKNLTIKDSYFFGYSETGALVSIARNSNMENVTVQARVVSKWGDYVGGFVGRSFYGTFKDCVFKGVVSSADTSADGIGGIAGEFSSILINSENQGRVEGYDAVGGLAGISYGAILASRNTGIVKGLKRVGGVIGQNYGRIAFCNNASPVVALGTSSQEIGGVIGSNNGFVSGLSNTADVQGYRSVGGVAGETTTVISGSYNTGSVKGSLYVGGVLGNGMSSLRGAYHGISSCFNVGLVKGDSYVGSLIGGKSSAYNSVALKATSSMLVGNESGTVAGDTLGGEFVTSGAFTDGYVLKILDSKRGSAIWIQGTDYPELQTVSNPEKKPNYYEISNASELLWFAHVVNVGASDKNTKVVLTDDIVFHKDLVESVKAQDVYRPNYEEWRPIYNNATKYGDGFEGTFDGQGHTISGLYFHHISKYDSDDYGDSLGLFRILEYTGNVRNVGIEDSYFRGRYSLGGVAGVSRGNIVNAHFSGYIQGESRVGGIVGDGFYNSIRDCYNEGEIISGYDAGGIVGISKGGTVSRCYNIGSISAVRPRSAIGGITTSAEKISNCYNWGPVKVTGGGGGIASTFSSNVVNSYNVGQVFYSDSISYKIKSVDSLGKGNYILKASTSEEPVDGKIFKEKTAEEFANGSVVDLLNAGAGYDMWVQGDEYPVLDRPAVPAMKDGSFLISKASELHWFMEYVNDGLADKNTKAKLVDDIVLRNQWIPIGYTKAGFEGEFDGQGHTISGVNVFEEDTSSMVVGFFAKLSETALVKNLTLKDASVKGGRYVVGGIVGNNFGRVENCIYEGSVKGSAYKRTGLIAGYDGGSLFGNIGICTSNCDSILVRSDSLRSRDLVKRRDVPNFVIKASERDDKKFKDGSFVLEANGGLKDAVWKQGKDFPYLGVEIPEFKDGAYQIGNLGQLFWAFNYVNVPSAKPVALASDIVVNKNVLKSDCAVSGANCDLPNSVGFGKLKSAFDGNGHKISGLYGDFFVDSIFAGGVLNNLKIEDSYFHSTIYYNGGVVSKCTLDVKAGKEMEKNFLYKSPLVALNRGTIRDVLVKGSLVRKGDFATLGIGGVAGRNFKEIINSRFDGVLEADSLVGGVAGVNEGSIDSSVFEGTVKGELYVGGIVGRLRTTVSNSVSNGKVVGSKYVGGIVGKSDNDGLKLSYSYNASAVEGGDYVGGLVGYMYSRLDTISDCFNIGSVVADGKIGGGLVGYMYEGNISYSFNYVSGNKLSIKGLIANTVKGYASINHSYAFYDGDAALTDSVESKSKLVDVAIKTADEFANGKVLELLTKDRPSYRWIQGEKYPVFGKMTVKPIDIPRIVKVAGKPRFDMDVLSRKIQVHNAFIGDGFALMDMQGRVIVRGKTELKNFEIRVPHAGSYLLKVGNFSRRVNVK